MSKTSVKSIVYPNNALGNQVGTTAQMLALFLLALAFVSLIAAVVGYQVGHRQGVHSAKNELFDQATSANVVELAEQNTKLQAQVSTLTQERDVSVANVERLSEDKKLLEDSNLQLTQTNELLKSSVADQGGVALKVLASEIVSLPENTFEYRFDVAMIDVSGHSVRMVPKLTLLNATSMVEIPLDPASHEINGVANIRGRFVMPEGFEPRQMKLVLTAGDQRVQQLYNWRVGKIIGNTPATLSEAGELSNRPIGSK